MVEKRSCSFCGQTIEPGTGKMFVRKDGTTYFFCSRKCEKNMVQLGRIPRYVKWAGGKKDTKRAKDKKSGKGKGTIRKK